MASLGIEITAKNNDLLIRLTQSFNNLSASQEKNENIAKSLVARINATKEAMGQLILEGKRETDQYDELRKELIALSTAYKIVEQDQKNLSSVDAQLAGIASGISGMSGALSAFQGISSLVIGDSEDLVAIQTKLQQAMSVTTGLQQVSNTLHETSSFRLNTVRKATELWQGAVTLLNTKLKLSVGLSKLLVTGGIGLVIAGVTAAIVLFQKWKEKQEEINKIQNDFKNIEIETAKAMADEQVKVKTLIAVSEDQNKTLAVRNSAINQLKQIMPDYNGYINEEGQLIANTDDALKKYIANLYKVEKAKKLLADITKEEESINELKAQGPEEVLWVKKIDYKIVSLFDKDLANKMSEKDNEILTQKWEDELTKRNEAITVKNEELKKLIEDKSIFESLFGQDNANETPNVIPDNKSLIDAEKKYNERLQALAAERIKSQQESKQKEIDLMEEGFAKRLKQIDLNYDKEMQAIIDFKDRKRKEQEEAAKEIHIKNHGSDKDFDSSKFNLSSLPEGLRPEDITNEVNRMTNEAVDTFTNGWFQIIRDQVTFSQEEELRFADSLEKQLVEIQSFYDERSKQAQNNNSLLTQIEKNRETAIVNAHIDANLKRIAHDEEMNKRRLAISDQFYLFESDKKKAQLNIELEAAKIKRDEAKKKQEQSPNDTNLARELEEAQLKVDEVGHSIGKLKTEKFQEIAKYATLIKNGLTNLLGSDNSIAVGVGWIADMAEAGAKIASMNPAMMIEGAFQVAGTVKDIINANKKAEKEIKSFYEGLEQMALKYTIAVIDGLKDVKSIRDSIFYTDTANSLLQGMKGYNAAIEEQSKLMDQLGGVTVKTGVKKKKFFGITTGTKDIYEGLLKTYPELIEKDGSLNRKLAETLLQSGNLSKEATTLINTIISTEDAAANAMQQVESILSNLTGSVGDGLKEALIDAFKNGTDSAEAFGDSVSKIMENIISDMIFSAVFGDMLKDLEGRMKASYDVNGDNDLTDDLIWFFNNYSQKEEAFNEGMKNAQEILKAHGFDIFAMDKEKTDNSSKTTSGSNALQGVSQDTISEAIGQLRALRMDFAEVAEVLEAKDTPKIDMSADVSLIAINTTNSLTIFRQQLQHQAAIERNTFQTAQILSEINSSGFKIREGNG